MEKFAERLKTKIEECQITQKCLADAMNVSVVTVSRWVNGRTIPSDATIVAIAKTLDCDVNWLKGIEEVSDNDIKRNAEGYYDPTAYKAIHNAERKEKKMRVFRGDIFEVRNFVRVNGSEQTANRPAVIVSNNVGNYHSEICEVVYLTTKEKNPMPTHVEVMCRVPSKAMCEQVVTVSQDRLGEFIRSCSDAEMKAIDKALKISLGLVDNWSDAESPDPATTVDNSLIDDLKMKLEGAERELDNKNTEIADLIAKLKESRKDNVMVNADASMDLLKAETERDLYKSQYEKLLEKLIAR